MPKVCDLTGKRPVSGHYVSHSNRKTKRRFYPNLQKKRYFLADEDRWVTLKVSTSAMKTINQKGLENYIRELRKKGKTINI
jgi:large subunit ribosomal protein L28